MCHKIFEMNSVTLTSGVFILSSRSYFVVVFTISHTMKYQYCFIFLKIPLAFQLMPIQISISDKAMKVLRHFLC